MSELSTQWLRSERAALARSSGRRKLDVFLESHDPEGLVRSLPAEDLFFAIHDIGLADAAPLVRLASPEQFRTFVDLDAWKDGELDPEKVLYWLRLARGDAEEGYVEKLAGLDIEVLETLLRGIVRIFDLEEEGEPGDDVEGNVERTPEGRFVLVYPSEGADYAAARRMIQDVYAQDPFMAGRLLYAVRWELHSELTETALRWRDARLADLGFPSTQEAASLYAKVDLRQPLPPPGHPPEEPPGFFLAELESGSLLDRAMGLLGDDARDELQLQLSAVMNAALVADRIEFGDLDAVRAAARAVRANLDLGLEHLAGGDVAKASTFLGSTALKRIFQIGFTLCLELSWRAQRLVKELPLRLEGAELPLPDAPDGDALQALLARRPRYHGGLDGPAAPNADRPFATRAELDLAAAALDRIEALGLALQGAAFDPREAAGAVVGAWGQAGLARARFSDLFLTAVARQAAGLDFGFRPLPASALEEVLRAAFEDDGSLRPSFRELALGSLGGKEGAGVRAAIDAALARLEGELAPQVIAEGPDRIDPRFAAPLIVKQGE